MSLHRRNPRRDKNEAIIVDALRAAGFQVDRLNEKGLPDILCSRHGQSWFLEVKARKGTLTAAQVRWRESYRGPEPRIVRSVEDALQFAREVA